MFDSDLTMGSARTQVQQHALMGLRRSVQMVNPIHFDKKSNPFGMPKSKCICYEGSSPTPKPVCPNNIDVELLRA